MSARDRVARHGDWLKAVAAGRTAVALAAVPAFAACDPAVPPAMVKPPPATRLSEAHASAVPADGGSLLVTVALDAATPRQPSFEGTPSPAQGVDVMTQDAHRVVLRVPAGFDGEVGRLPFQYDNPVGDGLLHGTAVVRLSGVAVDVFEDRGED